MSRIRPILTMALSRDMNGIAFGARPFFCVNLPVGPMDFLLVDDYDVMRNTMCLIGRFSRLLRMPLSTLSS